MRTHARSAQSLWPRALVSLAALLLFITPPSFGEEGVCKSKSGEVKAAYPDLARRMKIYGIVRLQLQLGPTGTVRDAKVLGGNPVLAAAAQQAVRNARFEGAEPCVITFEFKE
jgi:TonB family protein